MEGGAIGNAWHASQVTYTRDKEGRQENQKAEAAESKKKAKRLAGAKYRVGFQGRVVFLFWLHDLIPGYALLNKTIVSSKKCFISMFFEWLAFAFFYGAVCEQTCTMGCVPLS